MHARRATQDPGSQFGCSRDHVLAVVEHKQHPLVPKRGNQAGKRSFGMNLEPECGSNRAWHEERVTDQRQIDQPDAMLVGADLFLGDSDGDGRLSYPARSSDGEHTPLRQQLRELVDVIGTSNQPR